MTAQVNKQGLLSLHNSHRLNVGLIQFSVGTKRPEPHVTSSSRVRLRVRRWVAQIALNSTSTKIIKSEFFFHPSVTFHRPGFTKWNYRIDMSYSRTGTSRSEEVAETFAFKTEKQQCRWTARFQLCKTWIFRIFLCSHAQRCCLPGIWNLTFYERL